MNRFNLIDEPWLPVVVRGEPRQRDVSLREALARAPDIVEVSDPSPLVTVALYRLLLALCQRIWSPRSEEAWSSLWAAGAFDVAQLDAYLEQWHHRFDLFDPERPFYQTPGLPESVATTVAKLGLEFSAGNNPALFDHSLDGDPRPLAPAAAARLLVALQSFAIGGLVTRLPGAPPSAESSHLVKGAVHVVTGENLFETLVLNLVPMEEEGGPLNLHPEANVPAWEAGPAEATTRRPAGLLDLLTWQSRRVLLFRDERGEVDRATIMAGFAFPRDAAIEDMEPMLAFVLREAKGQYPWVPVGFRPEQALWRQAGALLEFSRERGRRAHALSWIDSLRNNGFLERDTFGLSLFGLASDRAKVFLWREERLPLPAAYVANGELVATLKGAVNHAADVAARLRGTTWLLASEALSPAGSADRQRVSTFADSLAPERSYWPRLDEPFRRFMVALATTFGSDSSAAALEPWAEAVRAAATSAFEAAANAIETSSRGYRAAALLRPRFYGELRTLRNEFLPEETSA